MFHPRDVMCIEISEDKDISRWMESECRFYTLRDYASYTRILGRDGAIKEKVIANTVQ